MIMSEKCVAWVGWKSHKTNLHFQRKEINKLSEYLRQSLVEQFGDKTSLSHAKRWGNFPFNRHNSSVSFAFSLFFLFFFSFFSPRKIILFINAPAQLNVLVLLPFSLNNGSVFACAIFIFVYFIFVLKHDDWAEQFLF